MITALIALLTALIAASATLLVADRTRYVNAVTTQRSAWIEKLRDNIAGYSRRIRDIANTSNKLEGEQKADLKAELEKQLGNSISEVNELNSLIKLQINPLIDPQLNPFGVIDRNIIDLLDKLTLLAKPLLEEKRDPKKLYKADELLIEHSRWLLKAEWEKVKSEARWTIRLWCMRNRVEEQERGYLARYRAFACGEGNPSKIDSSTS